MLVNEKNTVVAKDTPILPGLHLSNAKYTDVIERSVLDGTQDDEKIKLCVSDIVEMRKCNILRDVAFSRDIRPTFECILKDNANCAHDLRKNEVDAIVVQAKSIEKYNLDGLKPVMTEAFADNEHYVVVANQAISVSELKKAALYVVKLSSVTRASIKIVQSLSGNLIHLTTIASMQRLSSPICDRPNLPIEFVPTTLKTAKADHWKF